MQSWTEILIPLFRLRKVFENEQLTLFKIEGALTTQNAELWEEEFALIMQRLDHPVIFDCASLRTTNHALTAILQHLMSDKMFFLNLSTPVRNMLRSAGLGANVLD